MGRGFSNIVHVLCGYVFVFTNNNDLKMYNSLLGRSMKDICFERTFSFVLKGNTKFWEISKNGWIVILYNFDIFGCPCGCIKNPEMLAPKTLLLSRKIEYKDLPVLPVNFDKFRIAPTAVQ